MHELLPGTEVEARGLRWEVVFAERLGPQTLYRLRGLEGAVQGQELDLLHPSDPLQRLVHDFQPEKAAPLRNWLVYHQAFLLEQALGTDALLAVQPGRLRLEPYQLVPVLRAIRMSRPRLLLADGVGLGKTIQAGLVLTELIARRVAHRILIISPAGPLLEQWKTEMAERFGLRLDAIDRQPAGSSVCSPGCEPGDVLTMSGEDADDIRQQLTKRFRGQDGLVLVSTDTAAEGLNLQDRCHHLLHLELPFNPNRLEQRNGRIDRYGQTHHPMVRYLYPRGTFEERILLRLIAKYERQRAQSAQTVPARPGRPPPLIYLGDIWEPRPYGTSNHKLHEHLLCGPCKDCSRPTGCHLHSDRLILCSNRLSNSCQKQQ